MARSPRRQFLRVWLVLTSLWILAVVLLALLRYPESLFSGMEPFAGMERPELAAALLGVGLPVAILLLGLAVIWVAQGFRRGTEEAEPTAAPPLHTADKAEPADPASSPPAEKTPTAEERKAVIDAEALAMLRADPDLLDPELGKATLVDAEGPAGVRTMTAEDRSGSLVLVAFETGTIELVEMARMLTSMGALAEAESRPVRGILVARDFAPATRHAARAAPGLALRRYRANVTFEAAWPPARTTKEADQAQA